MSSDKTIQATDIIQLFIDGDSDGFFHVKEILPDVKPGWWIITVEVINGNVGYTWIVDEDTLNQNVFIMNDYPVQLKLHARVISEPKPKKVIDMTRKELDKHIDDSIQSLF